MHENVWEPRRTPAPAARRQWSHEAAEAVDVPFAQLTVFFVKASLAAALALTLTSVVWIGLLAIFGGVGAGMYLAFDASRPPPVAESSVAAVLAAPPPPPALPAAPAVVVSEPAAPAVAPRPAKTDRSASDAATDRLIRAEIERMRARR